MIGVYGIDGKGFGPRHVPSGSCVPHPIVPGRAVESLDASVGDRKDTAVISTGKV